MRNEKFVVLFLLLSSSFLLISCTETIKAMDQGTANIIRAVTGVPNQQTTDKQVQTVKVKSTYKSVDVRSDPSANNPPITSLPGGMEVLKISENDEWIQVSLDMEDGSKMDGWISKEMVEGSGAVETPTVSPANVNQQKEVQTVKVKSKYKSVNVRSDPSTSKPPVTSLPGGMEVLKISENGEWVQIRLDMEDGSKMDGWISKKVVE